VPTGITTDVETPNEPSAGNQLWNYPNPVTNQTTIRFQLPGTSNVTLKVYNVSGQLMKVLVDGVVEAGQQEAIWDVTDSNGEVVGSGSYLYELSVSPAQMAGFETFQPFTLRKVMVVVK
jgi:flagellar hook assembly protein FlgD